MANDLNLLGSVARTVSDFDGARSLLDRALALHIEVRDREGMADDFKVIGILEKILEVEKPPSLR